MTGKPFLTVITRYAYFCITILIRCYGNVTLYFVQVLHLSSMFLFYCSHSFLLGKFYHRQNKISSDKNPGELRADFLVIVLCKYWQKIEMKNMLITNAETIYGRHKTRRDSKTWRKTKRRYTQLPRKKILTTECSALNGPKWHFSSVISPLSHHNLSSYFLSHDLL